MNIKLQELLDRLQYKAGIEECVCHSPLPNGGCDKCATDKGVTTLEETLSLLRKWDQWANSGDIDPTDFRKMIRSELYSILKDNKDWRNPITAERQEPR
jgi:hypothetical protein